MKAIFLPLILSILFVIGCTAHTRIKGGKSNYQGNTGNHIEMVQSDDPKNQSGFNTEVEKKEEFIIPQGSTMVISTNKGEAVSVILSSNMPVTIHIKESTELSHGAAQKNSYFSDIKAKLQSMRPVQYVGIALLLFGIASVAYPPLRLIIGSITTSLVISASGIGMIALPILIVGNEMLILGGGLAVGLGYLFVHRYAAASTKAKVYKDFIDKNNNGINDADEEPIEGK